MSWPESLTELIEALRAEAVALDALRLTLVEHRHGFVAIRPSQLRATAHAVEPAAERVRMASARRAELAAAVTRALGLPPDTDADAIAARLAPRDAERLRSAAGVARRAAGQVRVENAVGADLLREGAQIQEGLWQQLAAASAAPSAETYDARSRRHDGREIRGRLVDGHA